MKICTIRYLVLLVFMLNLCAFAFAQNYLPYYHLVNEAKWQAFKENRSVADSLFSAAFVLVDFVQPEHALEAARNAMAYGNAKSCYHHSFQSLLGGMPWQDISSINGFEETDWLSKLSLQRDSIEALFLEKADRNWIELIDSMIIMDQFNRSNAPASATRQEREERTRRQEINDSIILTIICEQIRKNGRMPGLREVGYVAARNLDLMFRHVGADYMFDTLARVLIQNVLRGDFSPDRAAIVIDRYAIQFSSVLPYHFSPAIFGSSTMSRGGRTFFFPLRNRDCIEKLRYAVGLQSLERQIEMNVVNSGGIFVDFADDEFEEMFRDEFSSKHLFRPFIVNCDISEL